MKRTHPNDRDRRLRRAAILVASLDESTAEQVLSDMPIEDAKAIRLAMAKLDDVDPDEQSDVLAQFRRGARTATPRSIDAVELDASLVARFDESADDSTSATGVNPQTPWNSLSDSEAATIVDALIREHPQTVAVVISRLEPDAAAKILSLLPGMLQSDVLGRLAELDPADEHCVKVVETHLAQWITRQRERKQRLAAGLELVGRILQSAPDSERTVILTRLSGTNPELAERINQPAAVAPPPTAPEKPTKIKRFFRPSQRRMPVAPKPSPPAIADPLGELEQLDDATLMATLTQAKRQVVTLALAGASEQLMKRVLGRLPRRQAKQFRTALRDIGPTRLSDMFAAQQELALCARQLRSR